MPTIRTLGYASIFCNHLTELYNHRKLRDFEQVNSEDMRVKVLNAIADDDGILLSNMLEHTNLIDLQPPTYIIQNCLNFNCRKSLAVALAYKCSIPPNIFTKYRIHHDSILFGLFLTLRPECVRFNETNETDDMQL